MRRQGVEGVWVRAPGGAIFLRRGRFQSARALKKLPLPGLELKPPLSPDASFTPRTVEYSRFIQGATVGARQIW